MLYPKWLEKRKAANVNARTVKRNMQHWEKYYKSHKIIKAPVAKITVDMLEKFFHEKIKEHSLTVKKLNNMKFILKDILKMRLQKGYIESNPFNDIEVNPHACRPATKSNDISRVYTEDEQERFFNALNHEILAYTDNTDCYAICLYSSWGYESVNYAPYNGMISTPERMKSIYTAWRYATSHSSIYQKEKSEIHTMIRDSLQSMNGLKRTQISKNEKSPETA